MKTSLLITWKICFNVFPFLWGCKSKVWWSNNAWQLVFVGMSLILQERRKSNMKTEVLWPKCVHIYNLSKDNILPNPNNCDELVFGFASNSRTSVGFLPIEIYVQRHNYEWILFQTYKLNKFSVVHLSRNTFDFSLYLY